MSWLWSWVPNFDGELDAEQGRVPYWLVQDGAEFENNKPDRDTAQPAAALPQGVI
jgi:hypothetical protein